MSTKEKEVNTIILIQKKMFWVFQKQKHKDKEIKIKVNEI